MNKEMNRAEKNIEEENPRDYHFREEKRLENLKYEIAQEMGISHRNPENRHPENMGKHSKENESIK